MNYSYHDISRMIDHSLLTPTLTVKELEDGIALALAYEAASVCIMPYYLKRCAGLLKGSKVKASTTIGFPHGGHSTQMKKAEAEIAIADGCEELDMVVNISQVLTNRWDYVREDIRAVIEPAHRAGRKVKVIFENSFLKDEHKIQLCKICADLGADWVKTSTGYGSGGATVDDLKLMRANSPPQVQVKAAGGIRDFAKVLEIRPLGVSRIGASKTKEILDECRKTLGLSPIPGHALTSAGY